MKTKNIALTLALVTLVSCSNLAFAGFSVPGVGGGADERRIIYKINIHYRLYEGGSL